MKVTLSRDAVREAREAREWYQNAAENLAMEFDARLAAAIDQIRSAPLRWPIFKDSVRFRLLQQFPYTVFYRVHDDEIFVVAIAHSKRRPGYWSRR
ncbi:MAG: type II toxin-antitoxin system RelE/ParE family toxin [Planctomycetota bacterium]|nr:type II toxin-antitoxin system RelE/ParE family toxin [Planctomycetota bacterium]